ncbi:hypothetical protein LshimejAT787_0200920 [Lyophyllum shimeji]|uniref:ABM domain-containing protein n=1 Tax=Lyophyllum shimeji TaxID=47721 RepID=A0A9P3UIQ6_LYOSH|nr:hypothetical protein LshimejAT787_0200920 [Lyophyllum shimeji]
MPVIEFASIQLASPNSLHNEPIPALFERGCTNQSTFSSFPVYIFKDVSDASGAYIISGWEDVAQHKLSMDSQTNQEVMGEILNYMSLKSLVHPKIDFTTFPEDVSVVVMEKYAPGQEEAIVPPAKWVGSGVADEDGQKYKISVYGAEDAASVISSPSVRGKDRIVMQRVMSFKA